MDVFHQICQDRGISSVVTTEGPAVLAMISGGVLKGRDSCEDDILAVLRRGSTSRPSTVIMQVKQLSSDVNVIAINCVGTTVCIVDGIYHSVFCFTLI